VRDWLSENIRFVLTLAAGFALLMGAAAWVVNAEEAHERASEIEQISKQQAEIIRKHEQWITKEEALRAERERIKECLKHADNPRECL
jgi:cytochrome c-type biogenesis protein CcmH/NrfG